MGITELVVHFFTKPLGLIGVILALVGLYYGLTGNLLGWLGLAVGAILAFISEKG